ncbi:MAG: hypothetical protein LV479_01980 [Methylacidiphilales bacterium]|nr:hypothetical protein [Candidatus Methylacidiphilales bacterium]
MNRDVVIPANQDALDRAEKAAWREQEGWCSPQEATEILAVGKGPRFELIESEAETIP